MGDPVLFALKQMAEISEYVFCHKDGKKRTDIRTAFKNAMQKAGIENFKFHDLRHTFASHLVMNGADLLTVKELMGHRTMSMTLRYSHLSPEHKRNAVASLTYSDGHYMDTRKNSEGTKST